MPIVWFNQLHDHRRTVWLSLLAIALLVTVVAVYATRDAEPIHLMHRPDTSIKPHPLDEVVLSVFAFDRPYRIESVMVSRQSDEDVNLIVDPMPSDVYWHVISRVKPKESQVLRYGRWIDGLTPAVPGTSPRMLEAGYVYRLDVQTTEGAVSLVFEPKPNKGHKPD